MPTNRFGGYDYDNHGGLLDQLPEVLTHRIGQAQVAAGDGGWSGRGFVDGLDFTLSGVLKAQGTTDAAELWRDFVAQHRPYAEQPLQLDYFGATRYLNAQVTGIREIQPSPGYIAARGFEVDFYARDPFWYSTTAGTPVPIGTAGASTLSVGGRVYAAPLLTLISAGLSAGPTPGTVVLTDDFGEVCYVGFDGAGTVIVDSKKGEVRDGGTAYHEQWDGVLPYLNPGSAVVSVAMGNVRLTSISVQWTNRD